jgi:hypothetical protein
MAETIERLILEAVRGAIREPMQDIAPAVVAAIEGHRRRSVWIGGHLRERQGSGTADECPPVDSAQAHCGRKAPPLLARGSTAGQDRRPSRLLGAGGAGNIWRERRRSRPRDSGTGKAKGGWQYKASGFKVGDERKAKALLERVENLVDAGQEVGGDGPLTVKGSSQIWLETRRDKGVVTIRHYEARLNLYILPVIGNLRLDAVRVQHIQDIISRAKKEDLAPRTIRHIYFTRQTRCSRRRPSAI